MMKLAELLCSIGGPALAALLLCMNTGEFVNASPVTASKRQADAVGIVNLGQQNGAPTHWAAGVIYGEPDTQGQIADNFYMDAGLKYFRAGGAQLGAPARGWIWNEFEGRFQSTLSNYHTARKYGGRFQLLVHDIWGTDQSNSSTVWPGDNGDWTNYDEYLDTLIGAIKNADMVAGLEIDIWNEPDGGFFWQRSQQQYIDLFIRTYQKFRADPTLASNLLVGPSYAGSPDTSDSWWTNWFAQVVGNQTIPDQYTWHLEGNPQSSTDDLQTNIPVLEQLLAMYGAPARQININEYATFAEQVPSSTAWWISRLERNNAFGLRGNWLSGEQLHDFLASLLWRNSSSDPYYPNGDWQVYQYYTLNMTGERVGTTGSLDNLFDLYATSGGGQVKILCGTRGQTGTWMIQVNNMSAVGLPSSGSVTIQTWGFNYVGHEGELAAPTNRGTYAHTYSGNTLSFPVYQTTQDADTAWAFEFGI